MARSIPHDETLLDHVRRVQNYFETHGHLAIPRGHIEPDGFKLGDAVLRLRASAHRETLPSLLHKQLEELGFFLGSPFWSFVASLREYLQLHGHGYVPTHYKTPSGYGLGFACVAWRMKARRPEFPAHHREHLSRAGFAFDQIEARKIWDELNPVVPKNLMSGSEQQKLIVEGLQAFKQQYGHVDVPGHYTDPKGLRLGQRLLGVRVAHKKGRLSEEFRHTLEKMGVRLTPLGKVMLRGSFIEALIAFKAKHGHCDVPTQYRDEYGYGLGRRCVRERIAARKADYPQSRRDELTDLGVRFDVFDKEGTGKTLLQRLALFKAEYGHCRVARTYVCKDGYTLGSRIFNLLYNGEANGRGTLREKVIEFGVPATNKRPRRQAEKIVSYVREFVQAQGTAKIGATYITPDGFRLGHWLYKQRVLAAAGKEDRETRRRLEELGVNYERIKRSGSLEQFLPELDRFAKTAGHARVDGDYVSTSGYPLGHHAKRWREKIQKKQATGDQMHLLRGHGFLDS